MDYNKAAIELHKRLKGKIEVTARAETNNKDELSTAYTPGVAEPCREIAKDIRKVYDLSLIHISIMFHEKHCALFHN